MDALLVPVGWFTAYAFALPRLLAVMTILPLMSRDALPGLLRTGVVGGFALLVLPTLVDNPAQPHGAIATAAVIAKEVFIGLAVGVVLAIPMWAFENMGDLCDTQRGANIAQILNPLTAQETSPLGILFNQAIVTFLFATGGFTALLGVLYDSYRVWPVYGWTPHFTGVAPEVFLGLGDRLMFLMVLMAAPAMFAMFLAESGLALVSRFVPQLQVFFLAMPIKSGLCMLVFALYAAVLFDHAGALLRETMQNALVLLTGAFGAARTP